MQKKMRAFLLPAFVLIVLAPLLYNNHPFLVFSPDIQYVKAKVLRVLEGQLYADPITGFPTFHPPIYHLLLAGIKWLGISLDRILYSLTIFNVILIFLFSYRIIKRQFDRQVALWVSLMIPFIIEFMGCGAMFLATAFYFSIPFYLAGLDLYLRRNRTIKQTILCGVLWGLAYLISPAHLFLIGLAVLYELGLYRRYRHGLILGGVLLVMLVPFFIQAYHIFAQSLYGTSAFALWRGFPSTEFMAQLGRYIIDPTRHGPDNFRVWIGLAITILGFIGLYFFRKDKTPRMAAGYVGLAVLAYLLTFYHYLPQYAIRVHFFLSLFLAAFAVRFLLELKLPRFFAAGIILIIVAVGISYHLTDYMARYRTQNKARIDFEIAREGISRSLGNYLDPDEYILATSGTYRHYVLPYYPVHALLAHRSGEYFQVTSAVSEKLQIDYDRLMACDNLECLEYYCRKYRISVALVHGGPEMKKPVFQTVARHWEMVYGDIYFRIFRKP